jgi:hypothetical protein
MLDRPVIHTATKLTVHAEGEKAFRSTILGKCNLGENMTHQQVQPETVRAVRASYVIRYPDIAACGRKIGNCLHPYYIRIA